MAKELIRRSLNEILDDLPELACVNAPGIGPVFVKKGETGYWPAGSRDPEEFNARRGITKAQAEAMLTGSVFGFNCPGADPLNYQPSKH